MVVRLSSLMAAELFTIGYEGLDLTSFLRCLRSEGIECVIDVRATPFSRKKGFSKHLLAATLEKEGIHYVHLEELGSPRQIRTKLKANHDYDTFFGKMQDYLAERTDAIETAYSHVTGMKCCLMCFERLADMCHRKIVAQKIKERDGNGLQITHI